VTTGRFERNGCCMTYSFLLKLFFWGLLGWLVVALATAVRFFVFFFLLLSIFVNAMRVPHPDWNTMTGVWKERGTRVLTYMSPFFSDPSAYSNSTTAFRHNFFQEGMDNGYFVHRQDGSTYLMYSLSIRFAMLDLTNPAAVAWMQDIIVNQSVDEAGSSGWMCDFGEYLPFDAVLHSVSIGSAFFNSVCALCCSCCCCYCCCFCLF
jgi:alpha-glucosidase (family GH31 glycosyl hydrolase)